MPFWLGIRACRARVEKGATRSIATGTANVNVGSSHTDMVAEKIESETCRPSNSMLRDERDDLVHSASRVKGPPRPRLRLRQRRSHLVQRPACIFLCRRLHARQSASPVLKDGEVHVRDYCCAFPWHFKGHSRKRCRACWTDLSFDRDTLPTPERHTKQVPLLPQVSAS